MARIELKVVDDGRILPLWVGLFEANAIGLEIEEIVTPRPMTHDLLKNVIQTMGFVVDRVELTDIRDQTFFATIYVKKDGEEIAIDSRPSDAFSLALRWRAPIFVTDDVLERSETFPSIESWVESSKRRADGEEEG
jgi:uncharacterized protein